MTQSNASIRTVDIDQLKNKYNNLSEAKDKISSDPRASNNEYNNVELKKEIHKILSEK